MKSAIQTFLSKGPPDEAAIAAFIAAHGTFPIVEGRQATFVYHGPADAVNLRHWVFGLASSQPFERVAGTDLWHHTPDARCKKGIAAVGSCGPAGLSRSQRA